MKSNKDILDEFGQILIIEIMDRLFKGTKKVVLNGYKNPTMQKYNELFNKLSVDEKAILLELIKENNNNLLFDFLRVFEENEQFKLVYEEGGQQMDLNKISEMLKAEPIIEGGWIERFSKELKNDSPE